MTQYQNRTDHGYEDVLQLVQHHELHLSSHSRSAHTCVCRDCPSHYFEKRPLAFAGFLKSDIGRRERDCNTAAGLFLTPALALARFKGGCSGELDRALAAAAASRVLDARPLPLPSSHSPWTTPFIARCLLPSCLSLLRRVNDSNNK